MYSCKRAAPLAPPAQTSLNPHRHNSNDDDGDDDDGDDDTAEPRRQTEFRSRGDGDGDGGDDGDARNSIELFQREEQHLPSSAIHEHSISGSTIQHRIEPSRFLVQFELGRSLLVPQLVL